MNLEDKISPARKPWYKDWVLIPIIAVVYILDQLTKYLTEANLCPNRSIPEGGPFHLTCSFNTGTAFGLFPDQTIILILASVAGIAVLLLVYRHNPFPGPLLRISLGLQLGGALGNLTDRLRFGQVTDFVQLGFWPVFNLADASIVVGVIILAWLFLFSGSSYRKEQVEAYTPADTAANPVAEEGSGEPTQEQEVREKDGV